jgi:16S rRNA (cytidine1402-2'-O)-methyltransferase
MTANAAGPAPGSLLLVPNTLDLGTETVDLQALLPLAVIQRAAALAHWAVEDARSARAFLKRVQAVVPLAQALQDTDIRELPRPRKGSHTPVPPVEWAALLAPALAGHDMGLLSEAGLPAVADPGAALVAAAHRAGITVLPLPGASSLLLALAASGLNGQSFAFVGYLPQDATARAARIRELETVSRRAAQTQLMIETPYRNAALLSALTAALAPATQLSVSCGLTLPGAWCRTDTVAGWRARPVQMPDRLPAVYAVLA